MGMLLLGTVPSPVEPPPVVVVVVVVVVCGPSGSHPSRSTNVNCNTTDNNGNDIGGTDRSLSLSGSSSRYPSQSSFDIVAAATTATTMIRPPTKSETF